MSMVLTRAPLESIGMNGAGTQKRRSARLSHEEIGENEPPSKRAKTNGARTTTNTVSTKEQDGGTSVTSKKKQRVYENKDDDFSFTKGRRKKQARDTKVEGSAVVDAAPASELAPAIPAPPVEDIAPKTAQKKRRRRFPSTPEREVEEKLVRRNKRRSDEKLDAANHSSPQRKAHAQSHANTERSPSPDERGRPATIERKRRHGALGFEEEKIMRIALPFADTPIIRRNREMRKGSGERSRRSSVSMRGRRASSLIDEGRGHAASNGSVPKFDFTATPDDFDGVSIKSESEQEHESQTHQENHLQEVNADRGALKTALPHPEVPTPEFFKHISTELTEPRRMRCLLGWCGTRALSAKSAPSSEDSASSSLEVAAHQAAHVIQEELSSDLVTKGSLSDWFSRDDITPAAIPLRKKPNPRNIANAAQVEKLTQELERLEKERADWDEVVKSSALRSSPPQQDPDTNAGLISPLHPDLLDSPQRAIFEQLEFRSNDDASKTDPISIQHRLQDISENLEFAIDQFANGVHALRTAREIAERIADKSLADTATALEEREGQRAVGGSKTSNQMAALRSLASVLNSKYP